MDGIPGIVVLFPVLIPIAAAAIVAITGLFHERRVPFIAVTAGLVNAAGVLALLPYMGPEFRFALPWLPGIAGAEFVFDGLGGTISVVASVLGALILVYSLRYMEHEHGITRYYSLVLLFIGAMSGLVLAGNLLLLYFFWETVGICSFSLIGFHYDDPRALKGAIKAFVTTRIGDVGLIAGILTLCFSSSPRTFDISTLLDGGTQVAPGALAFAAYAMLLGAVGKSAQMPLHVWLPDAMEAPTSVSALIHAATMVNAGVYLVARMYPLFSSVPGWSSCVTWIGAITLITAAIMALAAKDLKRMLAYSTVSQLGYMFFAAGLGGVLASQFHLVSHAIFKALLFLAAGAVIHEAGTRDMEKLSGARSKMPTTAAAFLLGVAGLSGIPPFNGFFSKDMIFSVAMERHEYGLLAFAVAGALLTFTYSWRAYFRVFEGVPSPAFSHAHEAKLAMKWPLVALAVMVTCSWTFIGFHSEKLGESYARTAASVHGLVHSLSAAELCRETLTSPSLLISLLVMACGSVLVRYYDTLTSAMGSRGRSFMAAAYEGFYFDRVYLRVLDRAAGLGSAAANSLDVLVTYAGRGVELAARGGRTVAHVLDAYIIEGFGRLLGSLAFAVSRVAVWTDKHVIEGSGRLAWKAAERSGTRAAAADQGGLNAGAIALIVGLSVILTIVVVETGVWM